MELFAGFVVVVIVVFVVVGTRLLARDHQRELGLADEARRLGLAQVEGDAFGLAGRLDVDRVLETLHGRYEGAEVAVLTVQKSIRLRRDVATFTRPVVVRDPAGEAEVTEGMGGWGPKYAPMTPEELEPALRRAAQAR